MRRPKTNCGGYRAKKKKVSNTDNSATFYCQRRKNIEFIVPLYGFVTVQGTEAEIWGLRRVLIEFNLRFKH